MNNIFILLEILKKIENKVINRLKTFTENETCHEIRLKIFLPNIIVFTISQQLSFTYDVFTNIWAKFSKFLHKTKTWLRKLYVKVDLLEKHFFCILVAFLNLSIKIVEFRGMQMSKFCRNIFTPWYYIIVLF